MFRFSLIPRDIVDPAVKLVLNNYLMLLLTTIVCSETSETSETSEEQGCHSGENVRLPPMWP